MGKLMLLGTMASVLFFTSACQPVMVMKSYTEEYTDPNTGKKITYTESITQQPESRMPMHLKHKELYE